MPDFSKYSNYSERKAFNGVVFGANAPVLEVELNEVQQIADTKFKRMMGVIGNSVIPMSNGSISFSGNTLTLTNCVVMSSGFSAFIKSSSVELSSTNKYAYIKLEEKVFDGKATIKEYGNTAGVNTSNTMVDNRVGAETSRRRIVLVTMVAGASVPSGTDTTSYVVIGELSKDNNFVFTAVKDSIEDLGVSVVDGALCVTFEE
nr:MAG TPA: protein of unknown function (DUF4815) [Caudoviricetes sp.]